MLENTKLNYLVRDALSPCFQEKLKEDDLIAVIRKVNESLTAEEMDLLCKMVSRTSDIAFSYGRDYS